MPLYDVFLSHASADKPAVEHLAHKLKAAGIKPFFDKWHLVAGEHWQEALEEAVAQSSACAVFFGPVSKGGAWRNEETRLALVRAAEDASFRVIPVLLPGAKEREVSGFLRLRTWFDFRAGLDDAGALGRFIVSIQGKAPDDDGGGAEKPLLPYRCMAPAQEPFVQRGEYAQVRDALLAGDSARSTIVGITTAIHGAGGFGKTALAIELCYDEQVRAQYPDGILWTTMGEEIDAAGRLARVRDLIRWWTDEDPPAFETVSAASAHLRQDLDGKRVLLVVDDVWRPEDVTPFHGLAPLLITTRDSRTLPVDSVPVHVDAMEAPEAVRLLASGLPDGTGVDLRGLAKRLGEWPILLKIVNRQLRELMQHDGLSPAQSFQEVNEALDAEGLTVFDREDLESRGQAVARTVGASLRRLSQEDVGYFDQLAIFPEDKDIPLRVLEKLWGLGSFTAKKLCGRLHDLSLLLRFDRPAGTIRLHDVIRAYLLRRGESQLAEWHRRLLDAYHPANSRWPDLAREESYLWTYLVHHLIGAGESDVCRELLLDFRYLDSKLMATDISSLLADYSIFAEDSELRLVRDALQLSAYVLARDQNELSGQLLGRLLDRREMGVRSLLKATGNLSTPWLRPLKASLTKPGGALLRIIEHRGESFAVLSDGRMVFGSDDGTLWIWDVENGQIFQTLEGHSSEIRSVAVLDSRRVVSGSDDGALRVWDVESGQTLKILKGMSLGSRLVAVLDSRRVVSASPDMLQVWDVEGGQALRTLKGLQYYVDSVAVLDNHRVVFGSRDLTLRVWDVESGQTLQTLEGNSSEVSAVAALDSHRVVSGSLYGLRVWDVESGQILKTLEDYFDRVNAVAVLDSRRVVSGSDGGMLRVWDVESGQILKTIKAHFDRVNAVAVLDSRRVVSAADDGTLRVWDVESDQIFQSLEGHSSWIRSLAVLDSRRVVSVADDGTLLVWDVENDQTIQSLEEHYGGFAVAMLDSRRVVSSSFYRNLRVWDVESGLTLQNLEGHFLPISAVAVLDNRRVLSVSDGGILRVWDVESGQTLQRFEDFAGASAVAVLNSRQVVFGFAEGILRVWDVESGQTLQTLEGHSAGVSAVAVLDRRRIVSSSYDGTLRVWDVETGQTLQTLKGHSDWVTTMAVLDRRWFVSGSYDRTLRVWNVESEEVECLVTLDSPVAAVAVIPDRRIIVAGDASGRVHFFDFIEP